MWLLLKLLTVFLGAALVPTVGLPALFVFIDRVRARERLINANLGVSEWLVGISTVGVCIALDVVVLAIASIGGIR